MRMKGKSSEKTFLVFNTACFGDVLVCNTLIQNIKLEYPLSKVIFICDKAYVDIAKYQKDVDDVVVFDKNGVNKGILGLIKFVIDFPYKKPFTSFVTYSNMRNVILSYLLGAKHVYEGKKPHEIMSMPCRIARMLTKITHKQIVNLPIKYTTDSEIPEQFKTIFNDSKNCLVFVPISKNPEKDMPLEVATDVIKKLSDKFKVIYTGAGDKAVNFANKLKENGTDFVDLTNKTSFQDLARIIKKCSVVLSVDTGTMHLAYALEVPTVCVFYRKTTVKYWAPDPNVYKNVVIIDNEYTPDNMYSAVMKIKKH